jgi:hypothetical protein
MFELIAIVFGFAGLMVFAMHILDLKDNFK